MGEALGAPMAPKRVVVRVGGYPIEWSLPGDGWKGVRAELPAVFGEEVAGGVKIVKCFHLPHSTGGGGATPRVLGRQLPLPAPPLGAFSQQLVAKGVTLRRPWAPKAPDAT